LAGVSEHVAHFVEAFGVREQILGDEFRPQRIPRKEDFIGDLALGRCDMDAHTFSSSEALLGTGQASMLRY